MLAGKCPLKHRLDPVGLLLICVVACRSEWAVIAPRSSSVDAKMCADPEYLRSWRDLRRRELLFWFLVLSYVSGSLLIRSLVGRLCRGKSLPPELSVPTLSPFFLSSI